MILRYGAIDIENNTIQINSATKEMEAIVVTFSEEYYIPISELTSIYNIEVITTEDTAMIFSLYDEQITVSMQRKASLKTEASKFSKTITKLEKDEEVIYLGEAEEEGWVKILTYNGEIGYVQDSKISDKNYVRLNMEDDMISSSEADISNMLEIDIERITSDNLSDFDKRKEIVEETISEVISSDTFTVWLDVDNADVNDEYLNRFIIELEPRLKEIGATLVTEN